MKLYHIHRKQVLPLSLDEAWNFFSSPKNLVKITPKYMDFKIQSITGGDTMYEGQIIKYKLRPLPFLQTSWVTEITHVRKPFHFVDVQLSGPYRIWHHQHYFKETDGGVEIMDDVHYAVPFGIMGRLANSIFVERQVNAIFDYRHQILESLFNKKTEYTK